MSTKNLPEMERKQMCDSLMKQYDFSKFENFIKASTDYQFIYLLELFHKYFEIEQHKDQKTIIEDILFYAEAYLNYLFEDLNLGMWKDVDVAIKQKYATTSYIKALMLIHCNEKNSVKDALETIDKGLLLGFPVCDLDLTQSAAIISKKLTENTSFESSKMNEDRKTIKVYKNYPKIEESVCPTLETFHNNYFLPSVAVKLLNCVNHWPALTKWKDLNYLGCKMGSRIVPVELGQHYADPSYSQKLMTCREFIQKYFNKIETELGYLAQHQLFDQVPELKEDIRIPEYCAYSSRDETSDVSVPEPDINAWFGPVGTVSPLHHDPKDNILVQVIGHKILTLFSPSDSCYLYPHQDELLFNTSQVNVEVPDLVKFPLFEQANGFNCELGPGEMIFIPKKYWHHVRALSDSFSVSFWW